MSKLLEQGSGSASIEEPSLASSLTELIDLPDTPLAVVLEPRDQAFPVLPQLLDADQELFVDPKPIHGALVADNLPPMLAAAFSEDPVLSRQQQSITPLSIDLVEDQPFTVLLDGLISGSGRLSVPRQSG